MLLHFSLLWRAAALAALLSGAARACQPGGADAPPYQPGQGLPLGQSCVNLGGYAAAEYQNLRAAAPGAAAPGAALSHLSLFVWWEDGARLKFFSELDSQREAAPRAGADGGRQLALERAYFDYSAGDALTLRAGKFLTPIGRWNQLHAAPLVWTTSRPLITRDLFPDNATGLMALGNVELLGQAAEYTLYTALGGELRADPEQDPFDEAYGARLNLPLGQNLQLGLSYARFEQRAMREERRRLLGLDFLWRAAGYELSGEAVRRAADGGRAAWGGFIQGVAPLRGRLSAVARRETLRGPEPDAARRRSVLGLHYRGNRALSVKLEWIGAETRAPAGWLASAAILF